MKVALIYDRINKFGGAERVLQTLSRIYPEAPIYTLVHNPKTSSWTNSTKIIPTFFNRLKWLRTHHQLLAPFSALAFETLDLSEYDVIISITSESAKAVITKPNQLHICYCLTPTRYLWGNFKEYPIPKIIKRYFQFADKIYSTRPDHYLSISKEVKNRIKKYYHQDSEIIYPAIDFNFWKNHSSEVIGTGSSDGGIPQDYYLLVSRLEPYKKVDLAIKAFNKLQGPTLKLKIVGIGSQKGKLKNLAKSNIEFLGMVNDLKLRDLYANAKALIFPQIEDFGLTPLEAQATGTPVIALNKAGAKETVIDKKTGILFNRQTTSSLIQIIKLFESGKHDINKHNCQTNASKFDQDIFIKKFKNKIKNLWQKHKKTFM
jgi:glycosyltransferase involved in cell wall biosynthesis